ncbi:hypothetical protein D3C81_1640550 [compost metagenome]
MWRCASVICRTAVSMLFAWVRCVGSFAARRTTLPNMADRLIPTRWRARQWWRLQRLASNAVGRFSTRVNRLACVLSRV